MRGLVPCAAVLAALLALSSPAAAQEGKPDATLRLSQTSIAFLLGYTWGSGSLVFQDKIYRVEIGAVSVLSLGVVRAEATGEVFHLKRIEDFDGTYTAVSAEGTLANGAGATIMQNGNGVVIELFTTTEGLNLKLAPEGVRLTIR